MADRIAFLKAQMAAIQAELDQAGQQQSEHEDEPQLQSQAPFVESQVSHVWQPIPILSDMSSEFYRNYYTKFQLVDVMFPTFYFC